MFGSLGFPELLMIFVVALIVFGPRKLPEIGRTLGKALGEFKKATDELKNTIEKEVQVEELKEFRNLSPTNLFSPTVSRTEPALTPSTKPARWAAYPDPVADIAGPSQATDPVDPNDPLHATRSVVVSPPAAPVVANASHATASPVAQTDAATSPTLADTGNPGRAE